MKRTLILTTLFFVIGVAAFAVPNYDTILVQIDELSNFEDKDFSALYTIVSDKPGEDRTVRQLRLFRRDTNDQFVLLILQPQVERGQGYLQVDENMWFYDPESRRFERTTMEDTIQDSDAENRDLSQSTLSEDYRVVSHSEETLGGVAVWVLELESTSTDTTYAHKRMWVRKDVPVVMMERDYSVNNRLMRTAMYRRYAVVDAKYVPSQILIVDELNVGERTQVTLEDPSAEPIPDYVFSKQYLEQVSR